MHHPEQKDMRIVDVIRRWLGWCPQAQPQVRRPELQGPAGELCDPGNPPGRDGSFKARSMDWLGLFRNQILLSTIAILCVNLWMSASLGGGWSNAYLFVAGMIAGLLNSAVIGIWYWNLFNTVLHNGPVVLWNHYRGAVRSLTLVACFFIFITPLLALRGLIPGVDLTMTTAFWAGFVTVMTWVMLAGIWIWELKTHRKLHYDLEVLDQVKEEK